MESKLMLFCGLMLFFCATAIGAERVAYPHVGCFTGRSIRRYFNRKLVLLGSQEGEDDLMRCFKAARAENYHIFAVRKPRRKGVQCWTGRDAEDNLEKYQEASGCRNGLGGQKVYDVYLVPVEVKPCNLHPCKNGGTCQELGDSTYVCKCKLGYGGQNCTVKVTPCSLHPCKNGGTCQEPGNSTYVCKCKLGYEGQNCTERADFDSEILSHNEGLLKILLEYLKDVETLGMHWTRCFNARDHSYSAASFHAFCDNKGPTVTLVEVGRYVFGGYTDRAWSLLPGFKISRSSFVFSLRSSTNKPFKVSFKHYVCEYFQYAVHCLPNYGPMFGRSDLIISDSCHRKNDSHSSLAGTYRWPSQYSRSLAGSYNFRCDDYEVFYLA